MIEKHARKQHLTRVRKPGKGLPRPNARQREYQDLELGIFVHFGIRTFHEGHSDWDGKPMDPAAFNPVKLDCGQWVRSAKAAGAKYMVLTAKHHDGFANWPSKHTDYSVAATPWKKGRGDVIREYVRACRRYGMKVGLYYSPAEASPTFKADARAYDDYFINQIGELLSGYGTIDVLWFDGCGSAGHQYDWKRISAAIRRMQPNVCIFALGDPDFTWVGNEIGVAPSPCWSTLAADYTDCTNREPAAPDGNFIWLPAECDCRLRMNNWFFSDHDADTIKSVPELMGLYYYSVGRNCNLLLNVAPDRRGRFPEKDALRLREFGTEFRRCFNRPLGTLEAFKREGNDWEWCPGQRVLVDHLILKEDITKGERIRHFVIETDIGGWKTLYEGHCVGHKAICAFPPVPVHRLRIRVIQSEGTVHWRTLDLYNVSGG